MPTNDDDWNALPAPHQPRGHKVLSDCVYVYLDGTHLIIGNRTQQPQRLMGIVRGAGPANDLTLIALVNSIDVSVHLIGQHQQPINKISHPA